MKKLVLTIEGETSPLPFLEKFSVDYEIFAIKGELSTYGRYKGKISPYTLFQIQSQVEESGEIAEAVIELINSLSQYSFKLTGMNIYDEETA